MEISNWFSLIGSGASALGTIISVWNLITARGTAVQAAGTYEGLTGDKISINIAKEAAQCRVGVSILLCGTVMLSLPIVFKKTSTSLLLWTIGVCSIIIIVCSVQQFLWYKKQASAVFQKDNQQNEEGQAIKNR